MIAYICPSVWKEALENQKKVQSPQILKAASCQPPARRLGRSPGQKLGFCRGLNE